MADDSKNSFLNRDLSWLSFNHRVLMEAGDKTVPLYSRISFLSIFSSNLDEFFRVRMPSIFAFTSIESKKISLEDEYPKDLVAQVQTTVHKQLEEFGSILTQQIIPELEDNNIFLYYNDTIRDEHKEIVREFFLSKVLSFMQPVILRKDNQSAVFLENNALYFIVDMEMEARPGEHVYALLNIPSANLPRFSELPMVGNDHYILFVDDVIRENLAEILPGYIIHGAWSVKLTRDAEMSIGDEFIGDIAEKIERQLEKREIGHATRLLYDQSMPDSVKDFIQKYIGLRNEEMAKGVKVEFYNDSQTVNSYLTANYAINKKHEQIMEAKNDVVVVNISGRGDKDMEAYLNYFQSLK